MRFQAKIIPAQSRTYVIGDVHCSFDVLLAQIEQMRKLDCFKNPNSLKLHDNNYLIFTGDLADRGTEGTKVWLLAMGLKILNPNNVFISRGNHETYNIMSSYGFINELRDRFYRTKLEGDFELLFSHLPVAVFLGIKNKAGIVSFGMHNHAGLDERTAESINQLLQTTIKHHELLITMPSALFSEDNGLMWGDYISGSLALCIPSQRNVPDVFDYTLPAIRNSLAGLESMDYTIAFQTRGHQHKDGGVFILDNNDMSLPAPGFRAHQRSNASNNQPRTT